MVKYLYSRLKSNLWFQNAVEPTQRNSDGTMGYISSGVCLRRGRDDFVYQPSNMAPVLVEAVKKLNVEVAFTMCTDTTDTIFAIIRSRDLDSLTLQDGSQYQIVDSLADIASGETGKVKKFQYTCLVRDEKLVLIWHDSIERIMDHAQDIERNFLTLVGFNHQVLANSLDLGF
jgi:hypothetical protein